MSGGGHVPAGWYPDPTRPGTERWWDGEAWTAQSRPVAGPTAPPPYSYQPAAGPVPAKRSGCLGIATGVEVVNNSSKTSSYSLTVGYFDDGGQRLADSPVFLNHLRPGERAIEETFGFEDAGTRCEVVDVERVAAESSAGELAEVGACQLKDGANVLGSFEATVSATNGTPETSDYLIDVALVDADNVRRGSGVAAIKAVRPGESAQGDVLVTTRYRDGLRCEVIAASRNANS